MAEKLFYYLLALTLAGGFSLIYGMIVTKLRSRREHLERERLRLASAEIKRLQACKSKDQQDSVELGNWDPAEASDGFALDQIKQLQAELNQHVIELEREL